MADVWIRDFMGNKVRPLKEFEQEILHLDGGFLYDDVVCISAINYDTNRRETFEFETKEEWDAFQELWDGEYVFKTKWELESYDRGMYGS